MQYLHAPTAGGFGDKVRQAVERVATPYMAIADAESFLLPLALEQALSFLEAHAEYGACQGYSLAFEAHADHVDYYLLDRKGSEDYSGPSAEARLAVFAEDCPSLVSALRALKPCGAVTRRCPSVLIHGCRRPAIALAWCRMQRFACWTLLMVCTSAVA